MKIDSTCAAIDNDFIGHLAESELSEKDLIDSLSTIFKELNITAIIHPLVHKNELLLDKRRICLFFDENLVKCVDYSSIFSDNLDKKAYYFHLVAEFFGYLNNEDLPVQGEDILCFWEKNKSLGETHSLAMCLVMPCGLFLSDDEDSQKLRKYIYRHSIGKVRVYDRKTLIDEHFKKGESKIKREKRRSLAHIR